MKGEAIFIGLLIIALGMIFVLSSQPQTQPVFCTEEAKLCPDGSAVGRNPDLGCEFDPCPIIEGAVFCNPEQRNAEACIQLYSPVCGWFSPDVQCIRYPCAQTFSNSCFACTHESVLYYTEGECPA